MLHPHPLASSYQPRTIPSSQVARNSLCTRLINFLSQIGKLSLVFRNKDKQHKTPNSLKIRDICPYTFVISINLPLLKADKTSSQNFFVDLLNTNGWQRTGIQEE
jgi:hypothetical protein